MNPVYAFRSAVCAALLLQGASLAAQAKGDSNDQKVLELAKKECPAAAREFSGATYLYVLGKKAGLDNKQMTLLMHYCGFYVEGWKAGRTAEKNEKSSG